MEKISLHLHLLYIYSHRNGMGYSLGVYEYFFLLHLN